MKKLFLFLIAGLLYIAASAQEKTILLVHRSDFSLWVCDTDRPNEASYLVREPNLPGPRVGHWKGYTYWLDDVNNTLIRDGQVIGTLTWGWDRVWDVQRHHGFVIDDYGRAWMASLDSDENDVSFLCLVDLDTAYMTIQGWLGPGPHFNQVIGLSISWPKMKTNSTD